LPRHGHRLDECQDAAAADPDRGRFAVADGATESVYAAEWAQVLVDAFVVSDDGPPAWPTWLPPLQARWEEVIRLPADAPPRPWYLEEALMRGGAFATFLGLVLEPSRPVDGETGAPWKWQAHAIGDSCLFQVRRGELVLSFPLEQSTEFGSTPRLVGSRPGLGQPSRARSVIRRGDAEPDDRLWLMTDALAHWFLRRTEEGGRPWDELSSLLVVADPERAFADWVDEQRASRCLRNDDVTLLVVCPE
jgi:hypothetical protein